MTMRTLRLSLLLAAVWMFAGDTGPVQARTLASQLSSFINQGLAISDSITPVITRLGAQATDFPVPPTTPGYVFVYNPQQGVFERYQGSLGPVFLERVNTLGQNHVSFGMSYLYGNVNQFDGDDLAQGQPIGGSAIPPGGDRPASAGIFLDDFDLGTNKINFAASYGITDNWDVGFLVPLVVTHLQAEGRQFGALGAQPPTVCTPPNCQATGLAPLDASSTGVGDLLLRTKYRFGYLWDWGIAGGFVLRFPTGSAENFHGLGDWTVQPQLIISRAFGVQDVHANLGMEFNADNSTRTRARYGIGATLSLPEYRWIALLLDFVGTSGLDDEHFTTNFRFARGAQATGIFAPFLTSATRTGPNSFAVLSTIPRADQFNAAVGLKFEIWQNALGYMNAIVPLTRQGLYASVISAVGIEYSF